MEETQDEGLRLQPGVRRQLLSGASVVNFLLVGVYVISWEFSDDANIFSAVFFIRNGKKFISETSNIL